jgi:hypothetical protein
VNEKRRILRALAIAAAAGAMPAEGQPFLLLSGETLVASAPLPALLPDGALLDLALVTAARAGAPLLDVGLVAVDLAHDDLFADVPGSFRRAGAFAVDRDGLFVREAGTGVWRPLAAGDDFPALLDVLGTVVWRADCPHGTSCPLDLSVSRSDEVFADGFESGDTGAWSSPAGLRP